MFKQVQIDGNSWGKLTWTGKATDSHSVRMKYRFKKKCGHWIERFLSFPLRGKCHGGIAPPAHLLFHVSFYSDSATKSKIQYKNLAGPIFVHPPDPLEMSQSGFTAWGMGEAGIFLRMPSPGHWNGWAECDHSVTAFPEWGLCTSTCSTKQYLTFLCTQQIPFILFSPCINRNTMVFISKKEKKRTRFENSFCRSPLSAFLQKSSKS